MEHIFVLFLCLSLLALTGSVRLYEETSKCGAVYEQLCPGGTKNEFSVMGCLQRELQSANPPDIPKECHQELWSFKRNLMTEPVYITQMTKRCGKQVNKFCEGREADIMVCMLQKRLEMEAEHTQEASACRGYLTNIAKVVFTDYHLINGFLTACSKDVQKLTCGVIAPDTDIEESQSSQAEVIACLEEKMDQVSEECKAVLMTKEEQAADTFALDGALYEACREDREAVCANTPDDAGAVYDCLYRVKFDRRLSGRCRKEVVRRQLLLLDDYKIDYGLKVSCGEDLVTQHCLDSKTSHKLEEGFMRTVIMLQCLTEMQEMGDKKRVPVSEKCMRQVKQVKTMIMGDIELTPILGITCHDDVEKKCGNVRKDEEGGIVNCLIQLQATEDGLQEDCANTLEEFVLLVDPISDVSLNHALTLNCGSYIEDHCSSQQDEGEVMKCLMDLEIEMDLKESCHLQVLSYKYFMSRSILLDRPLLAACGEDAKKLCNSEMKEILDKETKPHGAVISCLYHHLFMRDEKQLSEKCTPELKRTIIAQGESVNLSPSVVSACTEDLVNYCSGFQANKDDYGCLQEHMISEADDLSEECDLEMSLHAELVSEDVRNDYRLMKACREVIHQSCKPHLQADTHGELLGCIVLQKPKLKGRCLKHVMDLQLISLYDYKFNKLFVDACNTAVQTYCKLDTLGAPIKKKQDVMYCLRDEVEQKKSDVHPPVSNECKAQLRQEFYKQMADLDLDPQLLNACSKDLKSTCRLDQFGDKLQVLECLRQSVGQLTPECKDKVFARELQQAEDPVMDVFLQKNCGTAIKLYCADSNEDELMQCLEANIHRSGVSGGCKSTLKLRMKKEHSNYQLNVELKKACKEDIMTECSDILRDIKHKKVEDGRGMIISCLKDKIDKISVECEDQITAILEQEVDNYLLDPLLNKFCENDIEVLCGSEPDDMVESCLRERIMDITSEDCTKQVIRLVTEAHGDVHLDPVLLRACQKDIGYLCGRIVPGRGNIIECLQGNEAQDKNSLTKTCSKMMKSRVDMWSNAYKRAKQYDSALEMMDDLYKSIDSSQYKQELLFYLGIAVLILVLLSFCGGRCTKRKPANKLY